MDKAPAILREDAEKFLEWCQTGQHSPGEKSTTSSLRSLEKITDLRNRQVDFLFIGTPISAPDLVIERVLEEPMVLAIPEGHALASQNAISFKSLGGVPLVIWPRHPNPEVYDRILGYFKNARAQVNIVLETFPLNSLVVAVAAGIGVSLVPDCARDNPQKAVIYRNLRPPRPTVEWGIAYKKKSLGEVQEAFLKVVRQTFHTTPRQIAQTGRRPPPQTLLFKRLVLAWPCL